MSRGHRFSLLLAASCVALAPLLSESSQADEDSGDEQQGAKQEFVSLKVVFTCSFTTLENVQLCDNIVNGLTLLRDTVHRSQTFQTADGTIIQLNFSVYDDGGTKTRLTQIYNDALKSDVSQLLIGPLAWKLIPKAMNLAKGAGSVLMLPNQFEELVQGSSHVFSVVAPPSHHLMDPLDILWAQGARTVSFVYISSIYEPRACGAGVEHAMSLGYTVLGSELIEEPVPNELLWGVIRKKPDVFVICARKSLTINLLVRSRVLRFTPKAILITASPDAAFVKNLGAPIANYLLGPVQWHQSLDLLDSERCPVFNTPLNFFNVFVERYGIEPTHEVAMVVGAAFALLAAATDSNLTLTTLQNQSAAFDQDAFAAALHRLNLPSFIGKLQFAPTGSLVRQRPSIYTLQVQPPDESESALVRYTTSKFRRVGANDTNTQVRYPMPLWLEKEIEIYPCALGAAITEYSSEDITCRPCPVGHYRDSHSSSCRSCEAMYSPGEGNWHCQPCPAGAECTDGIPVAKMGYYAFPDERGHDFVFIPCKRPGVCLGSNQCAGNNTGALCEACHKGFTSDADWQTWVRCDPCPSVFWLRANAMGTALFFVILTVLLGKLSFQAARCLMLIHVPMLKILMNYLYFVAYTLVASETSLPPLAAMAVRLVVRPVQDLLFLDCATNMAKMDVSLFVGIFLLPVALALNFFVGFCLKSIRIFLIVHRLKAPHAITVFIDAASEGATGASGGEDGDSVIRDKDHALQRRWISATHCLRNSTQYAVILIFLLYPVTLSLVVEPINCVKFGQLRAKIDLDLQCNRDWRFTLSILATLFNGVGIPLALLVWLRKLGHNRMNLQTRMASGFAYNGYAVRLYYFEPIYMLRKFLFILIGIYPDDRLRLAFMTIYVFGALLFQAEVSPFDDREFFILDRLEESSLRALVFTLVLRCLWVVRDYPGGSSFRVCRICDGVVFDTTAVAMCLLVHAHVWALAAYGLWNNVFMSHLDLKQDVAYGTMRFWERALLRSARSFNMLVFDARTHRINLSALNDKERHGFYRTTCAVLSWYCRGAALFHPGHLVSALREGVASGIRLRRARATNVSQGIVQGGVLRKVDRTFRRASLSTIGGKPSGRRVNEKKTVAAMLVKMESKMPDATKNRLLLHQSINAARTNSVTVGELQAAMLLCETDVKAYVPRYYAVEPLGFELQGEGGDVNDVDEADYLSKSSMFRVKEVQSAPAPHVDRDVTPTEASELVKDAQQPIDIDYHTLLRRRTEIVEERERLKAELERLRSRLVSCRAASANSSASRDGVGSDGAAGSAAGAGGAAGDGNPWGTDSPTFMSPLEMLTPNASLVFPPSASELASSRQEASMTSPSHLPFETTPISAQTLADEVSGRAAAIPSPAPVTREQHAHGRQDIPVTVLASALTRISVEHSSKNSVWLGNEVQEQLERQTARHVSHLAFDDSGSTSPSGQPRFDSVQQSTQHAIEPNPMSLL